MNLSNPFLKALGPVLIGVGCGLAHPTTPPLGKDDVHQPDDITDAAQKLDALVDGRTTDILPDSFTPPPDAGMMDVVDVVIRSDIFTQDAPEAGFDIFTDAANDNSNPHIDTISPADTTIDTPEVSFGPDVEVDVTTTPGDSTADTAVDTGRRYTRPAGGIFFLTFDGETGPTVNTQIPTRAPFGTLLGGTRSSGFIGNGLSLSGASGEGIRADTPALSVGTNDFLIYFDARFSGAVSQTPLGQRGTFFVGRNPTGNITFAATDGSCNVVSTVTTPADTWVHIAVIRSAGSVFIMLSGAMSSSTVSCPNNFISSDPSFIGGRQQTSGMNTTFFVVNGILDNIFAATGGSANAGGARSTYCATMEEAGRLGETGTACP